jgi:multidrug efflux pump subunit AcrB
LFVFLLRVRLTLCVACSIPVSVLLAIAWQYFAGGSFNLLTMCGITLGIGMLVDNSVVVIENISRLRDEGASPAAAAATGAREIALAVTLATLTTVVVFLPLIFMTEQPIVRVLFGGIGIPLSISLLASLLISVVFLPVVAARILGRRPRPVEAASRVLAPVAALPVRGIAWLVGGVRLAWHGLVSALFRLGRASVRVLYPLRFPLAALVVGGTVWRFLQTRRSLGTTEGLERFGVSFGPGSSPPVLGLLAAVAVLLLLVGLPRWRRRPSVGPAAPAAFVPAGTSLVGMIITLNQRLVDWTIAHRLAASGLAIAAFASTAIPASLIEMTPFGEDAVSDSIEFRVYFNAEYTLDESYEQARPYEEFLESKRDEWGFAHWSNRFDENDARFSLHFEQRRPKDELRSLQKEIMDSLHRISGHTLRFYEENVRSPSHERLTIYHYWAYYDELTRIGYYSK